VIEARWAGAVVRVAIADPALAEAVAEAIAGALAVDAGDGVPAVPSVPTLRVRSRRRLARLIAASDGVRGAIAIVAVTARNARHLVELIDQLRAAGAAGIQLVWDGASPPRVEVEAHVFAALERARAAPAASPVVLAADEAPAAALRFLVARRAVSA
jgi:hypothetical protein